MIVDEIMSVCKTYGVAFNPDITAGQQLDILDSVVGVDTKGGPGVNTFGRGVRYPNPVGKRVRLHQEYRRKTPLDDPLPPGGKKGRENYYFWGIEAGGEA